MKYARSLRQAVCAGAAILLVYGAATWSSRNPGAAEAPSEALAPQWAQYVAHRPKTIVELQPFRREQSIAITDALGRRGTATLLELNPQSNAWFLLTVRWADAAAQASYHLENAAPQSQKLTLDDRYPQGLRIMAQSGASDCALWSGAPRATSLEGARRSGLPYAPLCEARLYLRNRVAGTYTTLERVTNLLRDHVWGGEKIVGFVREKFYEDAFIESGAAADSRDASRDEPSPPHAPQPAALGDAYQARTVMPENLGIHLDSGNSRALRLGRWYAASAAPGIFVSAMQAEAVSPNVMSSYRGLVGKLDPVESSALSYLVALDLSALDLRFVLGTDHPRVGWSERALDTVRDASLPGPDGIDSVQPLVVNGIVNPHDVPKTVAAFVGGFKRQHGAFRYGALAMANAGTHYGFIEQGVIFSKLQPGLATLLVTDANEVTMTTWSRDDEALLGRIRYARQNGVPLIEAFDAKSGVPKPGALVNRWGPGNWSGSSEAQLRTLRAGVCMQETSARRFLIYGYFSSATPSAMARVFQAYGCRYGMLLDMNALEHTYFALYTRSRGQIGVQHLIAGMAEVDRKGGNRLAPRFLSFPDDRDFFYLTRKESADD